MDRSRTVAALAVALLALHVSSASATTPDPRGITYDAVVVGNASGAAIGGTSPGFDVVVRDVNSEPWPGRVVTLDFAETGMKPFTVQNAGTTINCAARTISRVTDQAGWATIAARVGGYENSNAIELLVDGVIITFVKGRSTDLDGLDGRTGLGDFSIFTANFLGNTAAQETDFDLSGTTALGDFAIFSQEFLNPAVGTYCP